MNKFVRSYSAETVVATMPSGSTVCDIAGLSVWCKLFRVAFGVITVDASAAYVSLIHVCIH